MTLWRVVARLNDRGETADQSTIRVLAPLEYRTIGRKQSPWKSYFSPLFNGGEGQDERPCLAHLTAEDLDAWAHLTELIKNAPVRARFADAVWELGKILGSSRTDLHLYGQRAAELYLEAADADATSQSFLSLLEILTRGISLGMQFRRPELIERGIRRMLEFADAADQAHLGLWLAPFERLIGLKGLSDCHRDEILARYERRLTARITNRDLHQIMMAGGLLAKYFHDHKNYTRAKEIALLCGEAVLEIAAGMTAALATHHIGDVLHWYRQVGLRGRCRARPCAAGEASQGCLLRDEKPAN